jgi:hypothetical protein
VDIFKYFLIDAKLAKARKLDLQTEEILSLNESEASKNTPRLLTLLTGKS